MLNGILIFFLLNIISCYQFIELPKYDYINVKPNSYVYLDISSFEIGQSIYLEFSMDLFFMKGPKDSYTFQIDQVPAKTADDYNYWKNLPTVINRNATTYSNIASNYNYSWVEIKKEGMNYIYIIPSEPFDTFYTFWNNKILIENTGGISERKRMEQILAITLPIVGVLIIVIIIATVIFIIYCKKIKSNNNNYYHMNYPPAYPVSDHATLNTPIQDNQFCPQENNQEKTYQKPIEPISYPSVETIN